MAFTFYSSFCKCAKRGRKIRRKDNKLSQFLKSYISGMLEAISLKFGMGSTELCGCVLSKNVHFIKAAQSYGGAKIAFSFFLSIYSQVLLASFLVRTIHYRVS